MSTPDIIMNRIMVQAPMLAAHATLLKIDPNLADDDVVTQSAISNIVAVGTFKSSMKLTVGSNVFMQAKRHVIIAMAPIASTELEPAPTILAAGITKELHDQIHTHAEYPTFVRQIHRYIRRRCADRASNVKLMTLYLDLRPRVVPAMSTSKHHMPVSTSKHDTLPQQPLTHSPVTD